MHDLIIQIENRDLSQRFDVALLQALKSKGFSISRATLKQWFQQGRILCNNRPVQASALIGPRRFNVEIKNFNSNELTTPAAQPSQRNELPCPVYEDEEILVFNKESGTPSVPHAPEETETAVGWALARVPHLSEIGRKGLEPGLIHRLDTGTSGLLVFAKTQNEFERLNLAWKNREVRKFYRAIAPWEPSSSALPIEIQFSLGHDAGSSKRMIAIKNQTDLKKIRGKPLSAWTRILSIHTLPEGQGDFEIELKTGVMHQIRCHLKSMNCPILGDPIYKGQTSERLWLHAWRLRLPLKTGAWLTLEAQLPPGWPGTR